MRRPASCPTRRTTRIRKRPPNPGGRRPRAPTSRAARTTRPSRRSSTRSIHAEDLCDPDELTRLRAYLDKQLAHLQGVVGRLANRLQRRLLAQQNRAWEFDLEEGMLDPARLPRIVIDPFQPLSFKREKDTNFRDTVVTLLLDNSGSMRGRPITVAATCADILARTLERCGVKVEILGFTTARLEGRAGARAVAAIGQARQSRPPQRPAPHHLQVRRRALAAGAQESRPDDARGPAQGEHRRRGARLGAQAPARPPRAAAHPDGDLRRRAGRRFDPLGQSRQLPRAAPALHHRGDRDPLAGRTDRHRHRPRRDALLPPRGDDRRCGGARRRDDREARRTVRGEWPPSRAARRAAGPSLEAHAAASLPDRRRRRSWPAARRRYTPWRSGRPSFAGRPRSRSRAKPIGSLSVADPRAASLRRARPSAPVSTSSSAISEFGGFSGSRRSPDGRDLVALADNAQWLTASVETRDGPPCGACPTPSSRRSLARTASRCAGPASTIRKASRSPAEPPMSAIERSPALFRFDLGAGRPFRPRARRLPCRPERALCFRAIADSKRSASRRRARRLPVPSSPLPSGPIRRADAPTTGFILTGPAARILPGRALRRFRRHRPRFLPTGDMLLLERRFSLLRGLCHAACAASPPVRSGRRRLVDGPVIFRERSVACRSTTWKAWRCIATAGETVVTMISDDNFCGLPEDAAARIRARRVIVRRAAPRLAHEPSMAP